jgi:CubicO group peptidase (beta-lactamase class C family)
MKYRYLRAFISLFALGLFFAGIFPQPSSAASSAGTGNHAAIDSYVKQKMQTYKIPGAAIAIVKNDQVEYLQGYGEADAAGRAITPQTPFLLASVSKSFTALAVNQLAEAGKLDLDAPVQKYLSWFRAADEQASTQITVRELLNHTSGFSEADGNRINLDAGLTEAALITNMKRVSTLNLINTPGAAFEYSNVNYGLLGAIVETVSGQSFESYVQKNILDPLDMKHSHPSWAAARSDGASSGYYPFFGTPIVYDKFMPYSRVITPWAGIFASAEDMAHYMIAQLNDGRYGDKSILSPQGMTALHQPGVQIDKWTGYAMGWFVYPDFDLANPNQTNNPSSYSLPISYYHEGSWAGFRSISILIPQEKTGITLLMNANDPEIESAFGLAGWDVLALYFGKTPAYYPPTEDFFRQHARLILGIVILLLVASLGWFLAKMRTWRRQPAVKPARRRMAGYILIPLAVDILIAWFLLAKQLPQTKATLWGGFRFSPDIYLLIVTVLLFTLVWGTIRTILLLQTTFGKHGQA